MFWFLNLHPERAIYGNVDITLWWHLPHCGNGGARGWREGGMEDWVKRALSRPSPRVLAHAKFKTDLLKIVLEWKVIKETSILELFLGLLALARPLRLPHFRHRVARSSSQNLGDERRPNECREAAAATAVPRRRRCPADRQSAALDRDRATVLLVRNLKSSVYR